MTHDSDVPAIEPDEPELAADADTTPADRDWEAEIAELKDQLLRALAEQENIRRRGQRETEDARKYGAAGFAKDLLSPADNLRRAIESVKPDAVTDDAMKNLLAGIAATERELLAAFERHGIKRLDPMGERFDHHRHQAIFEIESADQTPGTVVQVLQAGFVMQDRLLRAAMVGVAKAPARPAETVEPPRLDTTA